MLLWSDLILAYKHWHFWQWIPCFDYALCEKSISSGFYKACCLITLFGATGSVIKRNSEFSNHLHHTIPDLTDCFPYLYLFRPKCSSFLVFLEVEVSHDSAPFYCLHMPYHVWLWFSKWSRSELQGFTWLHNVALCDFLLQFFRNDS